MEFRNAEQGGGGNTIPTPSCSIFFFAFDEYRGKVVPYTLSYGSVMSLCSARGDPGPPLQTVRLTVRVRVSVSVTVRISVTLRV